MANLSHPWNLTPKEAIALQKELAHQVEPRGGPKKIKWIAGADVSYNRFSPILYAAVVILHADDLSVVEVQSATGRATFPYVPGLLTFREAPMYLDLFAKLSHRPDVVLVDGQGFAHPRRLGIASHLGLLLDIPTIGCAKSRLIGEFEEPPGEPGAHTPLYAPASASAGPLADGRQFENEEIIGSVLRTKRNTKPLFISVGHKIELRNAIRIVLQCCQGYRIPEPTRQAHLHVNELRRAGKG